MRATVLACLLLLSILPRTAHVDESEQEQEMELETSVCGLKEPFLFSSMAGQADESRLTGVEGVEDIHFTSQDGRILRGYRLVSRVEQPKGYLLILQGNAILADQLIGEFTRYARAGYDVYMYDYRGYGRSGGKRRLKAIVSDIREIVAAMTKELLSAAGQRKARIVNDVDFAHPYMEPVPSLHQQRMDIIEQFLLQSK